MKKIAFTLLGLSLSPFALAQESGAEPEKSWSIDAEVGLIATSGNTETASYKAKLDLRQDLESWRNQYILEGLYKEDEVEVTRDGVTTEESQTTAQKFFVSAQADYKLNEEHRGLFVFGSYEDDRFSGYDYQGTVALGYSDRLFKTDKSRLDYSVGPGVAFSLEEDQLVDGVLVEGEKEEALVLRVSAAYLYQISKNAKFTQTISSDIAGESGKNTKTRAESALTANISSAFALKASYSIQHNSVVQEDKEHTDSQVAVTLVFSY